MKTIIAVSLISISLLLTVVITNGQSLAVNTDGSTANASAILDVKSSTKGFLPPRMTTTERDAISSPVAGLMIYNTTSNRIEYYNGAVWSIFSNTAHYIGESYGGGIVFYVYDNGQHGLIASPADANGGAAMRWYAGTYTNTMARGGSAVGSFGVGAGKSNTLLIIANQGFGDGQNYAARVCNELRVGSGGVFYEDWYLPSLEELNLLYLQKTVVGGFLNTFYWSSTEGDNQIAFRVDFNDGFEFGILKFNSCQIRAIRSF